MAAIRTRQITAQLQIVGRIGKDHVDAGVRQAAHRLDAVTIEDPAQRQILARNFLYGAQTRLFTNQQLTHKTVSNPRKLSTG